jgi:hypothetical protein
MRELGKFQKGHKGFKPKGAISETTKEAKELLLNVISKEAENIESVLEIIRKENPIEYMKIIVKLLPFILPKHLDLGVTEIDKPKLVIDWSESWEIVNEKQINS